MQNEIENIKHIVEIALGQKLNYQPNVKDLFLVDNISESNQLTLLKHYLNNQHLITQDLITDLVGKQLKKYTFAEPELEPSANNWDEYLQKLEKILAKVKYRNENNYEFQAILPSKRQLLQLQQECWQFTNNLSCSYAYFIAMSQAAGITSFEYNRIGKFISPDHYLALINRDQRRACHLAHEEKYHEYAAQGGCRARGRTVIDATSMSNVLYYKSAQQLFYLFFAKKIVVDALQLEDYGQLPLAQRIRIWQLIEQHYPDNTHADHENIFYNYANFLNDRPGEFFNYFAADLPEAAKASPQTLHNIVKIVGLQSNYLLLFSRDIVNDWIPKRQLNLHWTRKYPLIQINDKVTTITLRDADTLEYARILPNELPYVPGHGLSLCGEGLSGELDNWNTPIDPHAAIDNQARDIEKLFREFKMFCPQINTAPLKTQEKLISMFHNPVAYSTIRATQHTHILTASVERFLLYMLPGEKYELPTLNASLELVQVGTLQDAMFVRINFADLDNEPLIQYLLQLNHTIFSYFGGIANLDVHLQICATANGSYTFIYEPHALLTQLEPDKFLNLENNIISPRRPQFIQPEGEDIKLFTDEHAAGLAYIRKFFDDTCKRGVHKFFTDYIHQ